VLHFDGYVFEGIRIGSNCFAVNNGLSDLFFVQDDAW